MFLVMSEKNHATKQHPLFGALWSHLTVESAVSHAQARSRFSKEPFVVVHKGKVVFTTI